MVELRLESLDAGSPAQDCYLGVRVGETQKLCKLTGLRTLRFQSGSGRRLGKIEVFKRVGACSIEVDPAANADREVRIGCSHNVGELGLRVSVEAGAAAKQEVQDQPEASKGSKPDQMKAYKEYLSKHGLEVLLSEAMCEVLRQRPDQPVDLLVEHLLQGKPFPVKNKPLPVAEKPALVETQGALKAASSPPAHGVRAPMANQTPSDKLGSGAYYATHVLPHVGKETWSNLYAEFPQAKKPEQVTPAPSPARSATPVAPVFMAPSVGTWLVSRRRAPGPINTSVPSAGPSSGAQPASSAAASAQTESPRAAALTAATRTPPSAAAAEPAGFIKARSQRRPTVGAPVESCGAGSTMSRASSAAVLARWPSAGSRQGSPSGAAAELAGPTKARRQRRATVIGRGDAWGNGSGSAGRTSAQVGSLSPFQTQSQFDLASAELRVKKPEQVALEAALAPLPARSATPVAPVLMSPSVGTWLVSRRRAPGPINTSAPMLARSLAAPAAAPMAEHTAAKSAPSAGPSSGAEPASSAAAFAQTESRRAAVAAAAARALPSVAAAEPAAPWPLKPSVGTWLAVAPRSPKATACKAPPSAGAVACQAAAEPATEPRAPAAEPVALAAPWALKPSVGSWIHMVPPPNAGDAPPLVKTCRCLVELGPPKAMTLGQRVEVERVVSAALLAAGGSLAGDYFPLRTSKSFAMRPAGMSDDEQRILARAGLLFEAEEADGRGVFATSSRDAAVWLNAYDHHVTFVAISGRLSQGAEARLETLEGAVREAIRLFGYTLSQAGAPDAP